MKNEDSTVLDRAIGLAVRAHKGMRRKTEGLPYIMHPLQVVVIASTMTDDPEVLAAAVLHDTVEDAGVAFDEIERVCGARVARLVASETEEKHPEMDLADSWKLRKTESLERLAAAEDPGTKIMWLSDKLANLRGFYHVWQERGDDLWQDFNQRDPRQQAWYYRSILKLVESLSGAEAYTEFERLIDVMFGGVEHEHSQNP